MSFNERCCVRSGVFLQQDGAYILDASIDGQYELITSQHLSQLAVHMRTSVPNRRTLIARLRELETGENLLEYQMLVMDTIRDAFMEKRRCETSSARSAVSETTDAGSVFSHQTRL